MWTAKERRIAFSTAFIVRTVGEQNVTSRDIENGIHFIIQALDGEFRGHIPEASYVITAPKKANHFRK